MDQEAQIRIVRPADRLRCCRALIEMHHHRKRVFIDTLGWRIGPRESWLEVDQFDDEFAVYIIAVDDEERHLGSVRLLPTTRPHMLNTVFADLCPQGAPAGPDVWEISRFLATPEESSGANILKVHRLLAQTLVEFAEANAIARYTLVAETRRLPALLSVGWSVLPLCLPTPRDGELIEAAEIVLDEVSVSRVRARARRLGDSQPHLAPFRTAA
jgi:N-acyl-L-homoserine lactone synthetase